MTQTLEKTLEAAEGGQTAGPVAADLQAVIEAWPMLSDDLKASIKTMVDAALRTEQRADR